MALACRPGHDGFMVNAWTWGLIAGTAVAAVLTFLLALALRRRPRAVGLGALLVPVTALWLWAFGITAEVQQTVTRKTFTAMIAVADGVSRVLGGPAGRVRVNMPPGTRTPTTLAIPPG